MLTMAQRHGAELEVMLRWDHDIHCVHLIE
jgi:hypothetical protein